MSDRRTNSGRDRAAVVKLEDLRLARKRQEDSVPPLRIRVEVRCHEEIGLTIENRLQAVLESLGCRVKGVEEPDWVLSTIAFSHGELIELSIILRRLFRSTRPGTETDRVDSNEQADLRQGRWLYESLRFHGLFGIRRRELNQFLERLANDLAARHWNTEIQKQTDSTSRRR